MTTVHTGEHPDTHPHHVVVTPHRGWRHFVPHQSSAPGPLAQAARWERRYVRCLLLLDTIIVSIAVTGGLFLRFGDARHYPLLNQRAALLLVPTWLALLASQPRLRPRARPHRHRASQGPVRGQRPDDGARRVRAYATHSDISRGFFLIALPGGFVALTLGRFAAISLLRRARRHGRCLHKVLAVGNAGDIQHLIQELNRRDHHGLQVVGACTFSTEAEIAEGVPVLGTPAEARRVAADIEADTVADHQLRSPRPRRATSARLAARGQ